MKHFSKALFLSLAVCLSACGGDDSGSNNAGGNGGNNNSGNGESATLRELASYRTIAFPGAEGGGSTTTGGAGCDVYVVTNLNDSGEGSLRNGLMVGRRFIVFAVSGQINLQSKLDISVSDITIAGQSAPGDGITLAGYPVYISGSNIILRFLRFRMGDQNIDQSNFVADDGDALGGKDGKNILIDHCSISWSTDECASFSRIENFTMQYCIISESLKLAGHSKGNHGYGGIWGGRNASYHHNLLADHDSRNPRFDHSYVGKSFLGPIDFVNNVVYNWGGNSTYGGESGTKPFYINMVNNYYKAGPSTNANVRDRLLELTSYCTNCVKNGGLAIPGKYFIDGNYVNGTAAGWDHVDSEHSKSESRDKSALLAEALLNTKYTTGLSALAFTESASEAYNTVLTYAGASLKRDAVDTRVTNDVKNGTGAIINSVSDTPGYPTLSGGTPVVDSDKDGMADDWEMAQLAELGVTDKTISDFKPAAYNLTGKYTNLEVYLNSLVTATFPAGANATAIK